MEAFDIDAVWYGGPNVNLLSKGFSWRKKRFVCVQVRNQQMGFREQAEPLQRWLRSVLRSLSAESESHKDHDDAVACITYVEPTTHLFGWALRMAT